MSDCNDSNERSYDPFHNYPVDHIVSREDTRFDAWEGDDDWAELWESDDDSDWDDYADHLDAEGHDDPPGPADDSTWCDRAESSDCDDPTIY